MFQSQLSRSNRFGLLTLVALGVFAAGFQISKAQTPTIQPPSLSLRLAVLLDKGPTKLAFTATNTGKTNIETTPLTTNGNIIIIARPNGEEVKVQTHKLWAKPPITIQPGQSKTWTADMPQILEGRDLREKGLYRVAWSLDGVRCSQEILLLKPK